MAEDVPSLVEAYLREQAADYPECRRLREQFFPAADGDR